MAIGKSVVELQSIIGYNFDDISILQNALTHSSYAYEQKSRGIVYPSNERLEFLGDAVLELIISEHLYEKFKNKSEGALTKMRQGIVCEKTLYHIALAINLGDYLNLGRGEENAECRKRPKVLADAMEAIIAAIYVDSGSFSKANSKDVILNLFASEINAADVLQNGDYKTMLQQLVEKDGLATLEYVVICESGPEHDKIFTVEARVNNNSVGTGTSGNKKDAEQKAAKLALSLFGVSI